MRISTIAAVGIMAAIAAAPAFGGQPGSGPDKGKMTDFMKKMLTVAPQREKPASRQEARERVAARMSETARRIKPGTVNTYGWWRNNWMPEDTYTYTYDSSGNVTVEVGKDAEGGYSRTVNEYNDNGKVVFKEIMTSADGVNYKNNRKTEFEYDPILTDVITKRTEWMWMGGDWQLIGNNYKRTINRDDEGKITSVVIAVLFDGIYDPTDRMTVTYGENGEAIELSEEVLDYDGSNYFWEQGMRWTDLVWERTDGQIYDIEDIFMGNNRIKSGHIEEPGNDGLVMDVTVEYADDSDAYTATLAMTMDDMNVSGTLDYTPLENDGYRLESKVFFMGYELMSTTEEVNYDDWGLLTLQSVDEGDYEGHFREWLEGSVDYDAEGRPATYIVTQYSADDYSDEVESERIIKAEYSDYMDVTAGAAAAVATEEPDRCFDLNGIQLKNPEKGRIVVRGGKKTRY